jgi:pimeloyl-ACP methyl ester carboxylesterase
VGDGETKYSLTFLKITGGIVRMKKRRTMTFLKVLFILLAGLVLLLAVHFRPDIPVEKLMDEYAAETSRFVQIDGMNVHYRDEGSGEPVVLVHGVLSSLHTWDGWAEELKRERRVIRLDLPSFGLTGPGTEAQQGIDYYVEFMSKFLDAIGIERVSMAGNSLGGGITWAFAARYPERVDKIVLLNASGFISDDDKLSLFKLAGSPVLKPLVRYCTPRYLVAVFVKQVYGDTKRLDPDTITRYYRLLRREGNRDVLTSFGGTATFSSLSDVKAALASIEAPALIIWGDMDSWIPVEHAYLFHEAMPKSELIIYEGAGHIPMEEIPSETVADVINFLNR